MEPRFYRKKKVKNRFRQRGDNSREDRLWKRTNTGCGLAAVGAIFPPRKLHVPTLSVHRHLLVGIAIAHDHLSSTSLALPTRSRLCQNRLRSRRSITGPAYPEQSHHFHVLFMQMLCAAMEENRLMFAECCQANEIQLSVIMARAPGSA